VAPSAGEKRGEDDVQHESGGTADEARQVSEPDAGRRLPVVRRQPTTLSQNARPRPYFHVSHTESGPEKN